MSYVAMQLFPMYIDSRMIVMNLIVLSISCDSRILWGFFLIVGCEIKTSIVVDSIIQQL